MIRKEISLFVWLIHFFYLSLQGSHNRLITFKRPIKMKKLFLTTTITLFFAAQAMAGDAVKATIHADQAGAKINKEIYGQFSEHLGSCIYGGLWVGENSPIPNINGYRKDVFEALKALKVPVLRWPGGCLPTTITGWMVLDLRRTVPRCATITGAAPSKTILLEPMNF